MNAQIKVIASMVDQVIDRLINSQESWQNVISICEQIVLEAEKIRNFASYNEITSLMSITDACYMDIYKGAQRLMSGTSIVKLYEFAFLDFAELYVVLWKLKYLLGKYTLNPSDNLIGDLLIEIDTWLVPRIKFIQENL